MSKAGYPCDNAPMERYYNTLKQILIFNQASDFNIIMDILG
jgi:transposase InsO family protein